MQSLQVNSDADSQREEDRHGSQGAPTQLCFIHSPGVCVWVKIHSFQIEKKKKTLLELVLNQTNAADHKQIES